MRNNRVIIWASIVSIIVGSALISKYVFSAGKQIQFIESKTVHNNGKIVDLEKSMDRQFKKVDDRFTRQDLVLDRILERVNRR